MSRRGPVLDKHTMITLTAFLHTQSKWCSNRLEGTTPICCNGAVDVECSGTAYFYDSKFYNNTPAGSHRRHREHLQLNKHHQSMYVKIHNAIYGQSHFRLAKTVDGDPTACDTSYSTWDATYLRSYTIAGLPTSASSTNVVTAAISTSVASTLADPASTTTSQRATTTVSSTAQAVTLNAVTASLQSSTATARSTSTTAVRSQP